MKAFLILTRYHELCLLIIAGESIFEDRPPLKIS